MKRIFTLTVLIAVFTSGLYAANYEEVMTANIKKMYQPTSSAELTSLANQFSRIASAEKDQWLPDYYAAFCYVSITYFGELEADEIQKQLDLAQAELDKAKQKNSKESEIHVLQAHIYQLRITDMSQGMKYSTLSNESLATAEYLNPENPRIYYIKGMNVFYTPETFGGGAENAKPLLEKAAELFESQIPDNILMPTWGAKNNIEMLSLCNSEK